MSTTTTDELTVVELGAFSDGTSERLGENALEIRDPATGALHRCRSARAGERRRSRDDVAAARRAGAPRTERSIRGGKKMTSTI